MDDLTELLMDRKQQILEIGLELLQTRGYASFSYADLSERLGITKASIHHHFPSKEDLGVALAQRYFEIVRQTLEEADEHDDPWERFEGYADVVFGAFGPGDRICAAGVGAVGVQRCPREHATELGRAGPVRDRLDRSGVGGGPAQRGHAVPGQPRVAGDDDLLDHAGGAAVRARPG